MDGIGRDEVVGCLVRRWSGRAGLAGVRVRI